MRVVSIGFRAGRDELQARRKAAKICGMILQSAGMLDKETIEGREWKQFDGR
jgi:hypothetical protein